MKFASLTEFARSVLHKVLTDRLIWAYRKQGIIGIERFQSSPILNVCGMVVLARGTVFATSCAQVVAAIFHCGHSKKL